MDFNILIGLANLAAIIVAALLLRGRGPPSGVGVTSREFSELGQGVEKLERALREDSVSAQARADERARLLREEVSRNLAEDRAESAARAEALRSGISVSIASQGSEHRDSQAKLAEAQSKTIETLVQRVGALSDVTEQRLNHIRETLEAKFTQVAEIMTNRLNQFERSQVEVGQKQSAALVEALSKMNDANDQRGERLRETLDKGLSTLRAENEAKLEQMRKTVDEQLQGTLEKRLGESFGIVTDHLKEVATGLGQMQQLATGFGDIKRVLTNVRPRGIWGEAQLEGILSDFLAADQFERNVRPNPNSGEVVEFAIRLPRQGDTGSYYIPVDSKFPLEDFDRLIIAADNADQDAVKSASEALCRAVRKSAQDIKTKYICPPHTADFAIMFLPSEGLYAEVARQNGVIESIGRDFGVMVAGPSNLMAHLSAVRIGFRSLAIQEQAGEISNILQRVQTEFGKYDAAVEKALKRANGTVTSLSALQSRQRQMGRALKGVDLLRAGTREDAAKILIDFEAADVTEDVDVAEDDAA